jgi:hypothetical protein
MTVVSKKSLSTGLRLCQNFNQQEISLLPLQR